MDLLKKAFAPRWPDLDNERLRLPLATRRAELIAPVIRGVVGRDHDDIVVMGAYQDRKAELRIGITFGNTALELATRRRLRGDSLFLTYDWDAEKYQGGPPPLASDPHERRWEYVAGCVGFEGDAEEVARVRGWIDRLPSGPFGEVVRSIERDHTLHLQVLSESVVWVMAAADLLSSKAPELVGERLGLLDELTAAIEGIWP